MKISQKGRTLLIENPLCGNGSVAKALGLSAGEIGQWRTPDLARRELGETKWRDAFKIVLVREPVARFLSGAVLALNTAPEVLVGQGAGTAFAEAVGAIAGRDGTPRTRAGEFLKLVEGVIASEGWATTELPIFMRPQSEWLASRFDLVIATHNIAEFFNERGGPCCIRSNHFHRNPTLPIQVTFTTEQEESIRKLYAEDVDRFSRLLVWSPSPGRVRLVAGYCATCEAKRKDGNFQPIDLTLEPDPEPVPEPGATIDDTMGGNEPPVQAKPAKKSKRRTRKAPARQTKKSKS
jgi:hypothetical protein